MDSNTRIFLSYAHKDLSKVKVLYKKLCEAGFEPWMDSEDITGGEEWRRAIRKAIRQAPLFLACLSKHSLTHRGIFQGEFKEALEEWSKQCSGGPSRALELNCASSFFPPFFSFTYLPT